MSWRSTPRTTCPRTNFRRCTGEFLRALALGGHLLLVTRVGDEGHQHRRYGYGGDSAPFDSYRLPEDRIAELLERAGFTIEARTLQAPEEGAKRPVA